VNAELKIAYLHEKVDRLSEDTYRVLTATQKVLALVDKSE
jgi:peptide subunit release factor RF-3